MDVLARTKVNSMHQTSDWHDLVVDGTSDVGGSMSVPRVNRELREVMYVRRQGWPQRVED